MNCIKLEDANNKLGIKPNTIKNLIFVYSMPKVGSTSIITSLRLFAINKFMIFHLHSEIMLEVLSNITDVSINDIILYNKSIGHTVYVIDVYRTPIELKISNFFENIGAFHFNNVDSSLNKYDIDLVITRFNNICLHIATGDHFMDKYNITLPDKFDHEKGYIMVIENDIKYIKLRLKNSNEWGQILSELLNTDIKIVKEYETNRKQIKELYALFKDKYKIPVNVLEEIKTCKYLNYYYSDDERNEYINKWSNNMSDSHAYYNVDEYNLYNKISIENRHTNEIQIHHYSDEGCRCKFCNIKRHNTKKNFNGKCKIIHERMVKVYIPPTISQKLKTLIM